MFFAPAADLTSSGRAAEQNDHCLLDEKLPSPVLLGLIQIVLKGPGTGKFIPDTGPTTYAGSCSLDCECALASNLRPGYG